MTAARIRVHDGLVEIDRRRGEALFTARHKPTPDALVHPHLAPVAAIAARWRRHESFHAGAVILGDGAWAVMGAKGSGKSSLLAWLALSGHAVLTDDLLVIDADGNALAGPRSIDLREGAAERFGVGEPLGVIGARERYRMVVGPVPAAVPLRGFIRLAWGGAPTVTPVPPAWRPAALAAQRAVRLIPRDPDLLVHLERAPDGGAAASARVGPRGRRRGPAAAHARRLRKRRRGRRNASQGDLRLEADYERCRFDVPRRRR